MNNLEIKLITSDIAKNVCRSITATLPEWFGIPDANKRYEQGMQDKTSFAARLDNDYVGMLTLEFPHPNNANIYWMAVKKDYHAKGIGKQLLTAVMDHCVKNGCSSLTVETLSPKQADPHYSNTFQFYKKSGFQPLFELYTYGPDNLMVYMLKPLQKSVATKSKINDNDVKLVPATLDNYPTLFNLARFYAYDISEFFGDEPGWEMEDDGLYGVGIDFKKYFIDKDSFPYFIRYKGELAGFAIVDKESIDPSANFNMAQFFVLRTYKRKGFGRQVAFQCFDKFKGTWEVMVLPGNEIAYNFWLSIIKEYTKNQFSEQILKNQKGENRITFKFSSDLS